MGAIEQFTISVPVEVADGMRAKVAAGDYADLGELVQDALLSLALDRLERERPALDDWIQREVLSAMREYDGNPASAFTVDEVIAHLRADSAIEEARR